jgi:UDP-glucose 4-epimerase
MAKNMDRGTKYFIVGGAGFIGSHFTDRLLRDSGTASVTLYDNFSSGREWHFEHHLNDPRLRVVRADVTELPALAAAMQGSDVVIHLASNPDIARAMTDPAIDFHQGTCLTHNVVEAMRLTSTPRILYASGSGVYGDLGELEAYEDYGPLLPISTYGASKLAGEVLICSYCHMFGLSARVFRFGNVVGPRQTHGVGFDFLRQLERNPERLRILGDGSQSKSYIQVDDVVEAVLMANQRESAPYQVYNVATGDYITVREIAALAVEAAGLRNSGVTLEFGSGDRGWKGDVPIVRLNTERIRGLGWTCRKNSREALLSAMIAMRGDARVGRMWEADPQPECLAGASQ